MEINKIQLIDCLTGLRLVESEGINLIVTSPPYNIGKAYEKRAPIQIYLDWQKELIAEYFRVLSPSGSLVYQVGNFIDNGKVYPLDCLLFSYFIVDILHLRCKFRNEF